MDQTYAMQIIPTYRYDRDGLDLYRLSVRPLTAIRFANITPRDLGCRRVAVHVHIGKDWHYQFARSPGTLFAIWPHAILLLALCHTSLHLMKPIKRNDTSRFSWRRRGLRRRPT
jgi:hypothetical protein